MGNEGSKDTHRATMIEGHIAAESAILLWYFAVLLWYSEKTKAEA